MARTSDRAIRPSPFPAPTRPRPAPPRDRQNAPPGGRGGCRCTSTDMSPQDKPALSQAESERSFKDETLVPQDPFQPALRAPPVQSEVQQRTQGVLGDTVLRFLGIRKGGPIYDPDAVGRRSRARHGRTDQQIATRPSIWDSESSKEYQDLFLHPEWEPTFAGPCAKNARRDARWTGRSW